jgi:geranylgeranyl diphosphate synthase, type II
VGADAAAGRHTFPAVIGLEASWVLAERMVADAVAAVEPIEGPGGPLAVLARYILERNS